MAQWALMQERSFLELLGEFSPSDEQGFSAIIKRCPNVDITYKELASWANVSVATIRRWASGQTMASKYDQSGLVEDIQEELARRIADASGLVAEGDKASA